MISAPSFAVALAIAVVGCSGATPVRPEPAPGAADPSSDSSGEAAATELQLKLDETFEYRDLELLWLELEDSRCPIGVTCVWEGQIVAAFEVSRGAEEPVGLELILRAGMDSEPGRAFDHELRLLGVDPHPKRGKTPQRGDYVARLEITEP